LLALGRKFWFMPMLEQNTEPQKTKSQRRKRPTAGHREDVVRAPLLTERQFAAYAQKNVDSIRRDRKLGTGPRYVKVGGAIRYRWEDIEEYFASQST
jgi:hypothetical protein